MNCFVVDFSQGNTKKNQAGLRGLYREGGLSERGVALEALRKGILNTTLTESEVITGKSQTKALMY